MTCSGSSWRLAIRRRGPGVDGDLERPGEVGLAGVDDRRRRRDELFDDGRLGALTQVDEGPGQEGAIGRSDDPADDDRALQANAGGDLETDPLRPQRPGELGEPVVAGEDPTVGETIADRLDVIAQRPQRHTGLVGRLGELDRRDPTVDDLDEAVGVVRQRAGPPFRGDVRDQGDRLEARRTQVDVRRVQQVRLGREGRVRGQGRGPIGGQPVRLRRREGVERGGIDRQAEVIERPTGRSRARRRGRRRRRFGGRGRHPSDPSISSLTRRLNSMAYSIGSSLVNTSRKPWTMRFVASFSVRPRAMR